MTNTIILAFMLPLLLITLMMTYNHEIVHKNIFNYFGHEANVSLTFWGGYARGDGIAQPNDVKMWELHAWNEIITYPVLALVVTIFVVGMIMTVERRRDG